MKHRLNLDIKDPNYRRKYLKLLILENLYKF